MSRLLGIPPHTLTSCSRDCARPVVPQRLLAERHQPRYIPRMSSLAGFVLLQGIYWPILGRRVSEPRFPQVPNYHRLSSARVVAEGSCHEHVFAEGERSCAHGGCRSADAAALRSQRRSRVERTEIRVRYGTVRCLHCDLEWSSYTFLRHACGNGGELGHHDARRPWHPGAAASDSTGVHRRASRSVRVLSQRRHSDGEGVSGREPERD